METVCPVESQADFIGLAPPLSVSGKNSEYFCGGNVEKIASIARVRIQIRNVLNYYATYVVKQWKT